LVGPTAVQTLHRFTTGLIAIGRRTKASFNFVNAGATGVDCSIRTSVEIVACLAFALFKNAIHNVIEKAIGFFGSSLPTGTFARRITLGIIDAIPQIPTVTITVDRWLNASVHLSLTGAPLFDGVVGTREPLIFV